MCCLATIKKIQMHEDCVAMETKYCILNKDFDLSDGLFVNTVLLRVKHYNAKLCVFY